VDTWKSRDGTAFTFRPIRPEDEPLLAKFHETLSERTVYQRYLKAMNLSQRIGHERLSKLSFIDYDREVALIAVRMNVKTGQPEIMGVTRIRREQFTSDRAEFTILVSDRFQHQGLGKELMRRILDVARAEKVRMLWGQFLQENEEMIALAGRFGFVIRPTEREGIVRAELSL
jgi:acetyltransferase